MVIASIKLAKHSWTALEKMFDFSAHTDTQQNVAASRRVLRAGGLKR